MASQQPVLCCLLGLILSALIMNVSAWGLGKTQTVATDEDMQILPQATSDIPAPVHDHYWWNAKTGPMAILLIQYHWQCICFYLLAAVFSYECVLNDRGDTMESPTSNTYHRQAVKESK